MSKTDKYFTFPLVALQGNKQETTPHACIDLALDCGMLNAGIGLFRNSPDDFHERLDEILEEHNITWKVGTHGHKACILVGANICGVQLGSTSPSHIEQIINAAESVKTGGALVRMSAKSFWAAFYQTKAEEYHSSPWPEHGMSWREFRILCAILSVQTNKVGYSFIGWETIQARSCGFTRKDEFKNATVIPDHLAPSLTRKQIRKTCAALEDLGFFACFRLSTGKVGGKMAYSIRHDRDELAKIVCDHTNFKDRARIRENRAADAAKCLQMLERAKSGPSGEQVRAKGGAKSGPT